MRNLNVAILVQRPINPLTGGIERISYDLSLEWKRYGIKTVAVSLNHDDLFHDGADIEHYFFPFPFDVSNELNISFFNKVIVENKINIILNQNAMNYEFTACCASVAKNIGVKFISVLHHDIYHTPDVVSTSFFIRERLGRNPFRWIKDALLWIRYWVYRRYQLIRLSESLITSVGKLSDSMVFLSKKAANRAKEWLDEKKVFYIPNGINVIEDRQRKNKEKLLLCVSRLEYGQKRIDRFIRIWAKIERDHPEWSASIVGEGPYRDMYEKLAKSLKCKKLTFEGMQNPDVFYDKSAILCMTSSSEGFGIVIVEAMMRGCVPVLFDSFFAASEIVDNGINGILIKPYDKIDYANKLSMLMNCQSMRERIAASAREKAKLYDISGIAAEWVQMFTNLITNSRQVI